MDFKKEIIKTQVTDMEDLWENGPGNNLIPSN